MVQLHNKFPPELAKKLDELEATETSARKERVRLMTEWAVANSEHKVGQLIYIHNGQSHRKARILSVGVDAWGEFKLRAVIIRRDGTEGSKVAVHSWYKIEVIG